MSKVKLRSRNFRLSKNDIDILTIKRSLRRSNSCEDESEHIKKVLNNGLVNDKNGSESSLAETASSNGLTCCKWDKCDYEYNNNGNDELEQHILSQHVKGQLCSRKHFQCLWLDCKVYGRKSLSYAWLERHIIEHTESRNKPFACVFNCSMRFGSQIMLERHVQGHLNESKTPTKSVKFSEFRMNDSINNFVTPFSQGNQSNIELKSNKKLTQSKKIKFDLTPYHVHRTDMFDLNSLQVLIRSNVASNQIREIDSSNSMESSDIIVVSPLKSGQDIKEDTMKPNNPYLSKMDHLKLSWLLTYRFEVVGSRKHNKLKESLVKFHLTHQTSKYEWISSETVDKIITQLNKSSDLQ